MNDTLTPIVSLIILLVVNLIVYMIYLTDQEAKERELLRKIRTEMYEKYGRPETEFVQCICENGAGVISDSAWCNIWKDEETYNFLERDPEKLIKIPESDLVSYKIVGEKHYVSEVSGGGGGGISLGGAVVGGVVGGATGAVIGSRKKNQPITTSVRAVSNQKTIINVISDGKEVYMTFDGNDLYDALVKISPSKELGFSTKALGFATNNTTVNQEPKTTVEQMKELKELLENDLITQEEYEKKKNEILKQI